MSAKTYTKRDIVKRTATNLGVPTVTIEKTVDEVFKTLREIMSEDLKNIRIEIRNFGTLEVKPTRAKPSARDPRTNKIVYVPARRKAHFKPGKLLKQCLCKPLDEL